MRIKQPFPFARGVPQRHGHYRHGVCRGLRVKLQAETENMGLFPTKVSAQRANLLALQLTLDGHEFSYSLSAQEVGPLVMA